MKRIITALLVLAMVVTMLPAFAISTSAAEKAKIEEGLNADWWLSRAETGEGEAGHWHAWRRIMGWGSEGYRASFDGNRLFDSSIEQMLKLADKTGTKSDITEFGGGFGRDDYKAATGVNGPGDDWHNSYIVKWTGTMKATTAGTYKFIGNKIDNGVVIFVNGEKAYEYWGTSHYFDNGSDNLISEQSFTITEAQVGQNIDFEMWFYEADGGEALAFTVTNDGQLTGKKGIAEAGFTFDLDAEYYTCNVKGGEEGDMEQYMQDGVKVDGNGNGSSAAEPGNHTYSDAQLDNIKSEMLKVGSSVVADMDNRSYQDKAVCQQFGMHYDCYMVEYTGYLTPSVSAEYTFGTRAVDNCFLLQLKINGEWKNVYEFWGKGIFNDRAVTYSGESYVLVAGTSYELRAVFLEINGGQPHQLIVKNEDTGVVYNKLNSTMYLTTEAIAKADFTPKAGSMTVDGDLSDWKDIKSLSVVGTDEFAGKKATWYAVVTDEGVYLACDAYHDSYVTTEGEWHRNTNFEFFLKEGGHVQFWVSAGQNGRASDNITTYIMKTETLGDATPKYHTVTEVFVANAQLPENAVKEGVVRAGLAWKTPGDQINNGGANAVDEWWCPKYRPDTARKHIVTKDGVYADTEFTFDVGTAEELMAYVKMVNANNENHNNFSSNLTLNITADIDLTGYDWKPLTRWIGTINGNGHTLSGMVVVSDATGGDKGILVNELSNWWDGRPVESGIIKDLTIKDSLLYAPNISGAGVGAFAGKSDRGILENCVAENITVVGGDWTGGIVGRASGGVKDSGDDMPVRNCEIRNSTVIGYATQSNDTKAVGAIVGTNDSARVLLGNYKIENVVIQSSEGACRTKAIGAPDTDPNRQPVTGDDFVETNVKNTAITAVELTAGAKQTWDAEAPAAITFTVTATENLINGVTFNGKALKASDFTVEETEEGVAVITIKQAKLEKTENGTYAVKILTYAGDLDAELTVVNNVAKTGDMSFIIVLVSTLALGAIVVTSKKRRMAK